MYPHADDNPSISTSFQRADRAGRSTNGSRLLHDIARHGMSGSPDPRRTAHGLGGDPAITSSSRRYRGSRSLRDRCICQRGPRRVHRSSPANNQWRTVSPDAGIGSSSISTRQRRRSALAMAVGLALGKPLQLEPACGGPVQSRAEPDRPGLLDHPPTIRMTETTGATLRRISPSSGFQTIGKSFRARCDFLEEVVIRIYPAGVRVVRLRGNLRTMPSIAICREGSGLSAAARMRTRVDFPAPFLPTQAHELRPAMTGKDYAPSSETIAPSALGDLHRT